MVKVAVFASGNGSNFERLVLAEREENLNYQIKLLIGDKKNIGALKKAENLGIKSICLEPQSFSSKKEYEEALILSLQKEEIDLIALAGFMRIIGSDLLASFDNRIINIHPAFLPEFPGKSGIEDAFQAGVSQTGVTIHYVDSGVDTGNIIYQERVAVDPLWGLEELKKNIHRVEHRIYPLILDKICKNI